MTIKTRARVALAVAMTFAGPAFGQTLADRVPGDSIVYLGWQGTADPGPGYAGSRWAAALKESNFAKLIDDTLPAAGAAAARKWPEHGPLWRAIADASKQLIKKPSAAFFTMVDGRPKFGVWCRAGADDKALASAFGKIIKALPPDAFPTRVLRIDGDVALVFNITPEDSMHGKTDEKTGAWVPEGTLAQDAAFQNAIKHVVANPTSTLYVNVRQARKVIGEIVGKNAPPENAERLGKFMEASGLNGVNAYVSAEGFDGRDWAVEAFVDAPAPRKGLLAMSQEAEIDTALVKRVPASANNVRVFTLDTAGLLDDAREITTAVDPQARDMLEKVVGASKLAVGRDLTTDLLPSLGTQWAAYTSSDVGGASTAGLVLVNRLKNPAKAKQAMVSLSLFLSNSGMNAIPNNRFTLGGRMTKVGDLQVYYAATPLVSPAWTIKDDCLYLAFYPQPVIEAARYAGPSIDTVPAFAELLKPKDGTQPIAVAYTDVLRTIDDGYASTLAGSRLLFGLSDMFLAPTPEPLLPSLPALRAQATPAVTRLWADAAGLHLKARSPFPGAETMATFQTSNVYAAPMAISILLPSLNRSREAAVRIKSSSNLRQIGLAAMMAANDDRQSRFPADFGVILRGQEITADVFINPRTPHTLPPVPAGAKPIDVYAEWVVDQSDYVWLGKGQTSGMPADRILAYEKPQGLEDGINVLFGDGHVEFVTFDEIDAVFGKAGVAVPER